MFNLLEHEITWSVVGTWTSKEYDFKYRVTFKHQPLTQMDSMIGSSVFADGNPYELTTWYFLRGSQLLIASKREGEEFPEFEEKALISLEGLSIMTSPVVHRRRPGFFSSIDRGEVIGEQFFEDSTHDTLAPHFPVFWIRFPTSKASIYEWQDATKFISVVKSRIYMIKKARLDNRT